MRFWPLLLILLLVAPCAVADDVMLMVNMNYSSSELKAAQEQAAARGQTLVVVPPADTVPVVEPMFRARDRLQDELEKQFPDITPFDLKIELAGVLREGAKWDGNRAVAAYLGTERMSQFGAIGEKVSTLEKRNGSIYDQLHRVAGQLRRQGDTIDSVIISSHSDGSNLTGETTNRLSANDLSRLKRENPEIFDNARHALLMGCYNLTKPNRQAWRYDLFPNASLLAGFGERAPSRYDSNSANYIRQVMGAAERLDEQLAATGEPLAPSTLNAAFRALSSFTTTSHPGVADYCYTIVEGQPGSWTRDCDTQWKDLYAKKSKLSAYWSLVEPSENPPTEGGGDLRNFYNTLQAACPAKESRTQATDVRGSERMRVTMRENVIRLIYWWNVQQNFATYYKKSIANMNGRLAVMGVRAKMPKLDGNAKRVDFVKAYNTISDELDRTDLLLARDFRELYAPLFYLRGENTVGPGEVLSIEQTLARGAIPFNWIEGTTVMKGSE